MWRHCKSPALQALPAVGHWYSALCLWEPFSQSLPRDAAAFEGQGEDGAGGQRPASSEEAGVGTAPRGMSLTPGIVVPSLFAFKSRDLQEYLYRRGTYVGALVVF